jgi:hypothetical protein
MFASVHPSPTAGDGRLLLKAKYAFPTDKPDHHRRCAMCGFAGFDEDTNQQGDSLNTPGISYGGVVSSTVKLPAYGPSGVPVSFTDKTVEPSVVGGCPFCGTYNPRGHFIGVPFDRGMDISNL